MARCPGRQKTPHSRKGCVAKRVRVGLIRKNPRKGFLWGSIAYLAGAVKPWGRGGHFCPSRAGISGGLAPLCLGSYRRLVGQPDRGGFLCRRIMGRPTGRWSRGALPADALPSRTLRPGSGGNLLFCAQAAACARFAFLERGIRKNARDNLESCKKERGRRGKGAREQAGCIAEKDGKLYRKCNITVENTGENHVKTSEKGCCFFWVG